MIRYGILAFVLLFVFSTNLFATHNRCGVITYKHVSGSTYKIFVKTCTKASSAAADRDSLEVDWGDRKSYMIPRDSSRLEPNDMKINYYSGVHTYSGSSSFTVQIVDPNHVADIVNLPASPGSLNIPFCLTTTIHIGDVAFLGYNDSPVFLNDCCVAYGCTSQVFTYNPSAYDAEGDSLWFESVPVKGKDCKDIVNYLFPNEINPGANNKFSVNGFTGEITWDSPQKTAPNGIGIYSIAILIKEYRQGYLLSEIYAEIMIIIYDCNNKPPTVVAPDDTCLWAGDSIFRTITAKDPDIGDKVTLTAQGGPLYLSTNPAVFTLQPAGNPVTGYFSWQTTCEHIRATAYSVTFRAEDDFEIIVPPPGKDIPAPAVALETWYITIVAPPVQNLQADASGNDILLTWDLPYVCEGASNFKGFAIWRKQTCDTSDIDSCVTGLAGKGYTKINTVNTFSYSYLDELVNRGIVYSYRVLAEFYKSNGINSIKLHFTESIPSNGVCEELSKNIPIITNVSVNITDRNNGEIYIKWTKPLADFASDSTHLDTTEITGPYVYKLYRSNGFFGSNPVQITSFTSPTFGAFNDSDYTDIGINTVDGPFSYTLEFYGETTVLIGTADVASSVYLSFAASDNRLDLTWVEYVPWLNYEYDIYRFNQGTLMWNNIGTSGTPSFSDLNLTNGREYCYYIESHGRFTSAGLPTNLLNLSQENCGIPIDTIPPCPPGLNIMTSCDFIAQNLWNNKYENILTWTNPNNYCADDVIQYNIYYKPNEGVDFTLLTSTFVATDTTYTHLRDIVTLAGCYAVTAIDSFYNESDLSEIICVDNCPIYELPNVFTPNSDGMNEHFTPFYPYRFIDHIDITIFNRWGQLVYSTNDPNIKWNGRYNGTGRPLSSGVYFYVCEVYEVMLSGVEKRTKPLTGFVHIIVSPPSSN